MSRHLPGFYWDEQRKRYFPQRQQVQVDLSPQHDETSAAASRYRALSDLRSVLPTVHKDALIHKLQSSQISLTNKVARSTVPLHGSFSAFQTVRHNGRMWRFAGDTHGWFYWSVLGNDHQETGDIERWQDQFFLSNSKVSTISISGSVCVATSFGPECKMFYLSLDPSSQNIHTTRIDSRVVHDIWSADLQGSRLVLGANKQAVVLDDIATTTTTQRFSTGSDVLALAQRENLFYTGLRNGDILRFDTRLPQRSPIYPLFDNSKRSRSVTNIKHLHDHQLLVSFIDGGMSTFDLRFPIQAPSTTFTGHNNSYTIGLPLVIDPYENFMFAVGQDDQIRVWSLITGGAALGRLGSCLTDQPRSQLPPEHRIAALQVVEEKDSTHLWAAHGTELYKYSLGYRSGIGV